MDRYLVVNEKGERYNIVESVRGCIQGTDPSSIYTSNNPQTPDKLFVNSTDDSVILSTDSKPVQPLKNVQHYSYLLLDKWLTKIYVHKSNQVTYTVRSSGRPSHTLKHSYIKPKRKKIPWTHNR